jgi:hypothetical protein
MIENHWMMKTCLLELFVNVDQSVAVEVNKSVLAS